MLVGWFLVVLDARFLLEVTSHPSFLKMSNMSKESIEEHVPFLEEEYVDGHHNLQKPRAPLARLVQSSWWKIVLAIYSVIVSGALVYFIVHGTPGYKPYSMSTI